MELQALTLGRNFTIVRGTGQKKGSDSVLINVKLLITAENKIIAYTISMAILPRYHAERFREIAGACHKQCNACRQTVQFT